MMQILKHYTQFDANDNWYIGHVVRKKLKFTSFSRHARYRYHNKGVYQYFSMRDIQNIISNPRKGMVIEARYIPRWGKVAEERYVFRSKYAVNGLNLIFSINTEGEVVTVYMNKAKDNHSTLDEEQYASGNSLHLN